MRFVKSPIFTGYIHFIRNLLEDVLQIELRKGEPGMVVYACNTSTQETESGGLRVWSQPVLHSKTMSQKTDNGGRRV
jgi:hypothetical protein